MKPYVSIDIETTGLDEDLCMVLEVGAVIDDWTSPVEDLPTFRCYVDNGDQIQGSPYALSMHPKILRYIATDGTSGEEGEEPIDILEPDCIAGLFRVWLESNGIHPDKRHITPAGKNFSSFDRQFLKKLPNWIEHVKMQHRAIDPGNLFWNPIVDTHGLPDTKTCMERAGIPGEVAHTAVEDAIVVVRLVRNWFDSHFETEERWV
jgi:DNA polymerase III alpha subunit (gram-positive type)